MGRRPMKTPIYVRVNVPPSTFCVLGEFAKCCEALLFVLQCMALACMRVRVCFACILGGPPGSSKGICLITSSLSTCLGQSASPVTARASCIHKFKRYQIMYIGLYPLPASVGGL